MSLLVSDMRFLLDQNVVLGLAAVSLDRVDFIKIRAITRILMSRSGNALANVKRGCGEDDFVDFESGVKRGKEVAISKPSWSSGYQLSFAEAKSFFPGLPSAPSACRDSLKPSVDSKISTLGSRNNHLFRFASATRKTALCPERG